MVGKIFSKKNTFILVTFFFTFTLFLGWQIRTHISQRQDLQTQSKTTIPETTSQPDAVNTNIEPELQEKVRSILESSRETDWDTTISKLEEVRKTCDESHCDSLWTFNQFFPLLAEKSHNANEFVEAGVALDILYDENWRFVDLDRDGESEVVVLQRNELDPPNITLFVMNFHAKNRVVSHQFEEEYLDAPNSVLGENAIETFDLTGDSISEIEIFLSTGRGGAHLYVFSYKKEKLKLLLKKDDLLYSEYTFTDLNKDGIMDILVKGYDWEKHTDVTQQFFIKKYRRTP